MIISLRRFSKGAVHVILTRDVLLVEVTVFTAAEASSSLVQSSSSPKQDTDALFPAVAKQQHILT
jgi:hypothetical protein